MRVLSPDDVRRMVRLQAAKVGNVKLWAELHGIGEGHIYNFLSHRCGPPHALYEALGIVRVMVLASELPPGSRHDEGAVSRRRQDKGFAHEDPMS